MVIIDVNFEENKMDKAWIFLFFGASKKNYSENGKLKNYCHISWPFLANFNEVEGTSRYIKSKNGETAKLILTYYFILKLLVKQRS